MIFRQLTDYEEIILIIFVHIVLIFLFSILAHVKMRDPSITSKTFLFLCGVTIISYFVSPYILSEIFLLVHIIYRFFGGSLWLYMIFPYLILIDLAIYTIFFYLIINLLFLMIEFIFQVLGFTIDIIPNRKIRKRVRDKIVKKELERSKWEEFSKNNVLKIKDIQQLVLKNKFDEGCFRLENLKNEIEKNQDHPRYHIEKNKFITGIINPLIGLCKVQKDVFEKYSRMHFEFESQEENPEIAKNFFDYCLKISDLHNSNKITDEFFKYIENTKKQIIHKLKQKLIKEEIEDAVNPMIDCDFLFKTWIDFLNILEKWRMIKKLKLDFDLNLKTINPKDFNKFFENGSIIEIKDNIDLLTRANLKESFLQDISLLVKGKHQIKKFIKKEQDNKTT